VQATSLPMRSDAYDQLGVLFTPDLDKKCGSKPPYLKLATIVPHRQCHALGLRSAPAVPIYEQRPWNHKFLVKSQSIGAMSKPS
jgi:hypothetical protein